MTTYLPLDVASNDFTAGKAGTHSGYFTTISGKSYIFVYTKDNSADYGDDSAMIGYDPSDVSATLNSGAGTGAGDVSGWAHSTTSFTANPHTLTHLSNTSLQI